MGRWRPRTSKRAPELTLPTNSSPKSPPFHVQRRRCLTLPRLTTTEDRSGCATRTRWRCWQSRQSETRAIASFKNKRVLNAARRTFKDGFRIYTPHRAKRLEVLPAVENARALRSMQTGQNSIAPENSLPQFGQVRWDFVLMDLTALQPQPEPKATPRSTEW